MTDNSTNKRFRLLYPLFRLWVVIWSAILRSDVKRLWVLTSLYAVLIDYNEGDEYLFLKRLNDELDLVNDVDVLKFPFLTGDFIWRRIDAQKLIESDIDRLECVRRLEATIPQWLRYSTTQDHMHDLLNLIDIGQNRTLSSI